MRKILVSIFLLVFSLCLVGCKQNCAKPKDEIKVFVKFLQLSEAYETNLINKDQLQEMADIMNGEKSGNANIDHDHLLAIKKNRLQELKTREKDATIDDIKVECFWNYNNFYVIKITDSFTDYPDVIKEITIDDITIIYSDPIPMFVEIVNEEPTFKLTIQNETGYELVGIKEEYKAGEEVVVKMIYEDCVETFVHLNGEYIGALHGSNSVKFNMPQKDSVIVIRFTIMNSEKETINDFLTALNPLFVSFTSYPDNINAGSTYNAFKEQSFFYRFLQIETEKLDDKIDYDIAQADYYIKFINVLTNDFVELQLYNVIASDGEYFYGWLKTSKLNLNGFFQFQIDRNLFNEIYNYFVINVKSATYYVLENNVRKEVSKYSCQKIINLICKSSKITMTQEEINELSFDLLITTFEPQWDYYPIEINKYNYEWMIDYETGIVVLYTIAPTISSQVYPNVYFQLSEETINKIKDNLTKQSYELINDYELLSFYNETMLINNVSGFPVIYILQDLETTSRFARVHDRYNEEFFNEYALMIIGFNSSSDTEIMGIDDIKFDEDEDKFSVIFDLTLGTSDNIVTRYYVLKIKKSTLPVLDNPSYEVEIKVNNLD